jgi:cbb3-type cytochrome oxidase maturation protein
VSIIYVLIPVALLLLGVAVWALFWAVRSGQFDDLDTQGWSVVLDDDESPPGEATQQEAPRRDEDE